jgi:hypothetical protein
MPEMKRLILCISILWISSLGLSLAIPEVSFGFDKDAPMLEQGDSDTEEGNESLTISTSTEAILSIFQFQVVADFSLAPKLYIVFETERSNALFTLRDFSIHIHRMLFTRIIQVHGP